MIAMVGKSRALGLPILLLADVMLTYSGKYHGDITCYFCFSVSGDLDERLFVNSDPSPPYSFMVII